MIQPSPRIDDLTEDGLALDREALELYASLVRREAQLFGLLRWAVAIVLALSAVGLQVVQGGAVGRDNDPPQTAPSAEHEHSMAIGLQQSVRGGR